MPPENAGVVVYQIANGVTSLEDSPENLAYKLTAVVDESDLAFVAWLVTQPRGTDRRSDEENPIKNAPMVFNCLFSGKDAHA